MNHKTKHKCKNIFTATYKNHLACVSDLISIENVNKTNKNGTTPIWFAVHGGDHPDKLKIMKLLIDYGADINHKNKIGYAPIHNCLIRSTKYLKLLVENGAIINYPSKRSLLVKIINICRPKKRNPIYENNCFCNLKYLIHNGLDINTIDNYKRNLLQIMIRNKLPFKYIKLLINQGININHQNKRGNTALHTVLLDHYNELSLKYTRYLLYKGANTDIKNDRGQTPFNVLRRTIQIKSYRKHKINKYEYFNKEAKKLFETEKNKLFYELKLEFENTLLHTCIKYFRTNKILRKDYNELPFDLKRYLTKYIYKDI